MKTLVLGVILSLSLIGYAKAENSEPSKNIEVLSNRICAYYGLAADKVAENVKKSVMAHIKNYENITNPTPTQMVKFLNRNKNHMTCGENNINYMAESLNHGAAYDQLFNVFMFDDLLLDDENLYVDINAVSTTKDGISMTTLDYMYQELLKISLTFLKEISVVKDMLN